MNVAFQDSCLIHHNLKRKKRLNTGYTLVALLMQCGCSSGMINFYFYSIVSVGESVRGKRSTYCKFLLAIKKLNNRC